MNFILTQTAACEPEREFTTELSHSAISSKVLVDNLHASLTLLVEECLGQRIRV